MPTLLAVTVGTSPVPVLLTICHRRPDEVRLLHSTDTAVYAHRVTDVLAAWFPRMPVKAWELGERAGDAARVRERMRPLRDLPAGWACDYTGGTTVMSVLLVEAHREAHLATEGTDRPELRSYWDEIGDHVYYDDGHTERCTVPDRFTVDTIRRLHGYQLDSKHPSRVPDLQERGAEYSLRVCQLAHAVLARREPLDSTVDDGIDQADAATIRAVFGGGAQAGEALELIVAALLIAAPLPAARLGLPRPAVPDEVRLNTKVVTLTGTATGPDDENELDVLARYGQRVVAISCKNLAQPRRKLASALGEINQKARSVYGGAARQALVSVMDKDGTGAGGHPVPDELSTLMLGPGLPLRGPHVITETMLRDLLADVIDPPAGQPSLRKLLRGPFGLATERHPAPPAAIASRLDGSTLIATLSGNVLATVAATHQQRPQWLVVLGTKRFLDDMQSTGRVDAMIGVPGARTRFVEISMTSVPAVTATVGAIIDASTGPVVVDLTGGTKVVSVAGYLAVCRARAHGRTDLRSCYTDIWSAARRWLDGTTEPLTPVDSRIGRLLVATVRHRNAVSFIETDPAQLRGNNNNASRDLRDAVARRLCALLPAARLYRPCLTVPGSTDRPDWNWLPAALLLVIDNRLVGVYGHDHLGTSDTGLGEALFVDALVGAVGGDVARTVLVTAADDPAAQNLPTRYRTLVRRPFPPRVLTAHQAHAVLTDADAAHDVVAWIRT